MRSPQPGTSSHAADNDGLIARVATGTTSRHRRVPSRSTRSSTRCPATPVVSVGLRKAAPTCPPPPPSPKPICRKIGPEGDEKAQPVQVGAHRRRPVHRSAFADSLVGVAGNTSTAEPASRPGREVTSRPSRFLGALGISLTARHNHGSDRPGRRRTDSHGPGEHGRPMRHMTVQPRPSRVEPPLSGHIVRWARCRVVSVRAAAFVGVPPCPADQPAGR